MGGSIARRRRVAVLASATLLALSVLGSGTASATTPSWTGGFGTSMMNPTTSGFSTQNVAAGNNVGSFSWLHNGGTSNISQLYLTAKWTPSMSVTGATWTILDNDSSSGTGTFHDQGTCPVGTSLNCSFGALNAGQTVYVVVSFAVPSTATNGTSLTGTLDYYTTGVSADKGGNSHGDDLLLTDSATVAKSANAAGNFNLAAGLTISDSPVTGNNRQQTKAHADTQQTGLYVADEGATNQTLTCPVQAITNYNDYTTNTGQIWDPNWCTSPQWSEIQAGGLTKTFTNGFGGPGLQVTIVYKNNTLPPNLTQPDPVLFHWVNNQSSAQLVYQRCTFDVATGLPLAVDASNNPIPTGCLNVSGNTVVAYLYNNGNMR
jgi:hypothetical protein